MIDSYADKTRLITVLNTRNGNTDTVLHILSKRDSMLDLVEYLLCLGVDISVCNASGETPVEVAWRFSMSIYNYYLLTTTGTSSPPVPATESNYQQQRNPRKNSFTRAASTSRQTSIINTSLQPQQYNQQHENILSNFVANAGAATPTTTSVSIRTRASLGLSQTIDYTGFFKEGSSSSSDNGSEESEDEECSHKRKVTSMNRSLIRRLDEMSSSSTPTINKNKEKQKLVTAKTTKRKRNFQNMKRQHKKQTNAYQLKHHHHQRQRRKRLRMMEISTSSDEDSSKTSGSSTSSSNSSTSSDGKLDDIVKYVEQRNNGTRNQIIVRDEDTGGLKTLQQSQQNKIAIITKDEYSDSEKSLMMDIERNQISTPVTEREVDHVDGLESPRRRNIDQIDYDSVNEFSNEGMVFQSGYREKVEDVAKAKRSSSKDFEDTIFTNDDDGNASEEGERQENDKIAKEEILRKICKSIQTMYTLYEMEPPSSSSNKEGK